MENIWQSKSEIHLRLPIEVINFYQCKVSIVESFKLVQNQLYPFKPYKPTCIQILWTDLNRFPASFWAEKNFFLETQDKFLYRSFPFDVVLAHIAIKLRRPWTPKVFQKFFSGVVNHKKDHDPCISHKLIITAVVCSLVFSHLLGIFKVFLGVMDNVILLVHFCVLVWVLFGVLSFFVLRHLVIIPIYNTKKLPIFLTTQSHSRSISTFHSFLIFQ